MKNILQIQLHVKYGVEDQLIKRDRESDRSCVCVRERQNLNECNNSGWLCMSWCVYDYEPMMVMLRIYAH